MREYEVVTAPEVWEDIRIMFEHHMSEEDGNIATAEKKYRAIDKQIRSLKYSPERSRIYGRYYSVKAARYRIIYTVDRKHRTVKVLHVWHAKRNILAMLEDK